MRHIINMRLSLFILFSLCAMVADAQLALRIDCDRRRYVSYEPIQLRLTLQNNCGSDLAFDDPDSLDFIVVDKSERLARKLRDPGRIIQGLNLANGETRTVIFPINTYFVMQDESDYQIYAQLGHSRLNNDYRSNHLLLEVRRGSVVWQKSFGLSGHEKGGTIKSRQATLLRFQEKESDIYCLRVEDDESVYSVARIARHIIGAEPECRIDALSNIHIFLRIKARLFLYHVYDSRGRLKQEKYFVIDQTRPSLYRDPELGEVNVVGGRPALKGVDYVVPEEGESSSSIQGLAPVLEPL